MTRQVIVVLNDLHCGNDLAVCDPDSKIYKWDDKNKRSLQSVVANAAQRYLWGIYSWGGAEVLKFAKDDEIIVIVNGDYTDGSIWNAMPADKVTIAENNQVRMAFDVINHIVKHKQVKAVRFTSSTSVHAYPNNSADYALAEKFSDKYPDKDIRIVQHGLAQVGGINIDYAHHGPGAGIRQWTRGNVFSYYTRDIVIQSKDNGDPIPHVILRGHTHERLQICHTSWFNDAPFETWGFIVPSFQMSTPFGQKMTKSNRTITNGMLAFEIEDGKIGRKLWLTKTKKLPLIEKIL